MLGAEEIIRAQHAAFNPDQPVSDFGLPDTPEVRDAILRIRAEIAALPPGVVLDVPAEFPDPGDVDLYDKPAEEYAEQFFGGSEPDADADDEPGFTKAVGESMFTLGPMYVPDRLDAHGEWTDATQLQKAVWDYSLNGDRQIRLQHNRDVVAGTWSEIVTWPYEVTVPMFKADGSSSPVTYPANTVFLGVHWEPWAWELVKAGKLRGYSVGGKAKRILVDLGDAA